MASSLRRAQITGGPVLWSDGSKFNGFVLIALALPKDGGFEYAQVVVSNDYPAQRLPQFQRIAIAEGLYDGNGRLIFTADMQPPNTRYCAYYYDSTGRLIAGPTALFAVTSSPVTLVAPTLTAPVTNTVAPSPET